MPLHHDTAIIAIEFRRQIPVGLDRIAGDWREFGPTATIPLFRFTREGRMFRDRALRVALVLVGLMLLSGVFSLMHYNNPARAFEQMLASVYATLGAFLIIAAFNPPAHRSLIAFTAWSSLVHGSVMGVQAVKGVIPHSDLLLAVTPMLAIGVVFLLLTPPRPTAGGTG
jgi:hypothetical protein